LALYETEKEILKYKEKDDIERMVEM